MKYLFLVSERNERACHGIERFTVHQGEMCVSASSGILLAQHPNLVTGSHFAT